MTNWWVFCIGTSFQKRNGRVRKDVFRPERILQASPDYARDKSSAVNSHLIGGGMTVPRGLVLSVCRDLGLNTVRIPVPPVAWPSRTGVKPMDEPWGGLGCMEDWCWDMVHAEASGCPGRTSQQRIAAKGFARMSVGGSTIYFIWIIHDK